MCRREIGSELALFRCIREGSGVLNFAVLVIWNIHEDIDTLTFSEEHYPVGIGLEEILPPEDFSETIRGLNRPIFSSELPFQSFFLCKPCNYSNFRMLWPLVFGHGAEQFAGQAASPMVHSQSQQAVVCTYLQLFGGFWMERCSLYVIGDMLTVLGATVVGAVTERSPLAEPDHLGSFHLHGAS